MEESVLDLVPQNTAGQTNLDKSTFIVADVVEHQSQPINVHLLEDNVDSHNHVPSSERGSNNEATIHNATEQSPRNPTFNIDQTSSDTYEQSQIIQNAIDIVESDDEHLELKQSAPQALSDFKSNLDQNMHSKQDKRKRDNSDDRIAKLNRLQEEGRPNEPSMNDNEATQNTSLFVDQNISKKLAEGIQNINGVVYNDRGYEICGHMNQHNKPCQRIGNCPFHGQSSAKRQDVVTQSKNSVVDLRNETQVDEPNLKEVVKETPENTLENSSSDEVKTADTVVVLDGTQSDISKPKKSEGRLEGYQSESIVKKVPFKQGWSREEHIRFLIGLSWYGKGAWKEISSVVVTRSPTQIQSHAQKYFLRQRQPSKNKKSIHDITMEDLQEMSADAKQSYLLPNQRPQTLNAPVNQPSFTPPLQNNQKDTGTSANTQPTSDFRSYSNSYPPQYPVHNYQPQGPSTYQYSFPSGQSQLQVPVIPNPQPIPTNNPVYSNNTSVYPPMPYPQPTYQPQPPPPQVHYGYPQPPPTYAPPHHVISNNNYPPAPNPQWPQPPPSYQVPPYQQQSQYNYMPNNAPAMPYPMNQNPTPYPPYHANAMYSPPYLPQDTNRNNAYTTNTNNIYPPNWSNPPMFSHAPPGEHPSFQPDTEIKHKKKEEEKLDEENTLSENLPDHHDSFDQFGEITDINDDHQTHDMVPSFSEDTQKYLL